MKYSVIIPIYNAEKTLKRCLDSLLPQLNNDIEVLLINDGSTDNSAEICKEYVAKNSCFKYYEQENAGVSAARNRGVDISVGTYVLFIDSDDSVKGNAFRLIDKVVSRFDYDFIVSKLVFLDDNKQARGITEFESKDPDIFFPKISSMICNKRINAPIGKVYKRSILNEYRIRFPEGCDIAEDRAFNIIYSLHIKSMCIMSGTFYLYTTTVRNSLSRTIRSTEELEKHFVIERIAIDDALSSSSLDEKYIRQIKAADDFCTCRQVYSHAKRMKLRGANKNEIMKGIRKDCKVVNSKKMKYPKTNYCRKIYLPVKLNLYWIIYKVVIRLAENPI